MFVNHSCYPYPLVNNYVQSNYSCCNIVDASVSSLCLRTSTRPTKKFRLDHPSVSALLKPIIAGGHAKDVQLIAAGVRAEYGSGSRSAKS